MKKYIGLFIVAGLCASAVANVVTVATILGVDAATIEGASSDLFDGVTVTAHSALHPVSTIPEDWFTAPNATELLFEDAAGTKFIEFNTASAVTLRSVVISLSGDTLVRHIDARSITRIKFYAGISPESVKNNRVADVAVNADYTGKYGSPYIQVVMNLDTVTGQYFRVEFDQPLNGARVREIDGYAELYNGSGVALTAPVLTRQTYTRLPSIPELIFGVNQVNIGKPESEGRHWPLTNEEAEWFKSLGCNTIRFPVYPNEVGIDETLFLGKTMNSRFDPSILGTGDWRSLDGVIDWMIQHQLTPNVCPSPEFQIPNGWQSKTWMSLHVPENADRSLWFTQLIVDHLTEKYGDQIIYGWYEDWWWNSYKHEDSVRFPDAFRGKLAEMYNKSIKDLNAAWGSDYKYFYKVDVPDLLVKDTSGKKVVPPSAINSRRTYDLRKAMDLLQRDRLTQLHTDIKQKAPGALWIGPCLLNQIAGLADIHTVSIPRCNATAMTLAMTSDLVSADLYTDTREYYSHYRIYSKIAATQGKKLLIAEVPAIKPRAFEMVADVGGPSGGALAWCGKWDLWGFLKDDGTRRVENANEWAQLYQTYNADRPLYSEYRPGSVHVYFPWETLSYTISDMNFSAAYAHVCDYMMPKDLEVVLTPELRDIPSDVPIYVLERTMPLEAIEELIRRGDQVVSFHDWFMDENGKKHSRGVSNDGFFERLASLPGGEKLMDAFHRVEERANNVAYTFSGASISTSTALAEANAVLPDRPHLLTNLISGDYISGVTFSDQEQDESVLIRLGERRKVYGAFIEFFEGDGQFNEPSRLPERIVISASEDGINFREVAVLSGDSIQLRSRCRFSETSAEWIRFDFGSNTAGSGLKLVNTGVLSLASQQKESTK